MDVTRRSLARILAAAAAAQQPGVSQTAPTNEDLDLARALMRTNAEQIAKVKLPMATEPAFHFKA